MGLTCLALALVLAGCLGSFGGGQDGPLTLNVSNQADAERTFDVYVGDGDLKDIEVRYEDGQRHTTSAGQGLTTRSPGDGPAIRSIEFPADATRYGSFTLDTGETHEVDLPEDELPRAPALAVVIRDDDGIVEWVTATCRGDFVYLEVLATWYGSSSAYHCG